MSTIRTTRQIAGGVLAQITTGHRTVSTATREKFTQAVEELRSELADDAIFEFCLGEIMRQVDAQSTAQEEEQRAARSRFPKLLTYDYDDDPKPYSGRVPTSPFLE
jgi:hypothetical protein